MRIVVTVGFKADAIILIAKRARNRPPHWDEKLHRERYAQSMSTFIRPTSHSVENGTWDTSKALVRRTLERCIHLGRQHRQSGKKQDEYEAYRLLGTAVRNFF